MHRVWTLVALLVLAPLLLADMARAQDPVFEDLVPAQVYKYGGHLVTIQGTDFPTTGVVVRLSSLGDITPDSVSTTAIEFTSPQVTSNTDFESVLVSFNSGASFQSTGLNLAIVEPGFTGVTPSSLLYYGGETLSISGHTFFLFNGLQPAVRFNTFTQLCTIASDSLITCDSTPGSVLTAGTNVDVEVSMTREVDDFVVARTVPVVAPTFLSLSPDRGYTWGGDTLTIAGNNIRSLPGTARVRANYASGLVTVDATVEEGYLTFVTARTLAVQTVTSIEVALDGSTFETTSLQLLIEECVVTPNSLSPTVAYQYGGESLTVSGTNFLFGHNSDSCRFTPVSGGVAELGAAAAMTSLRYRCITPAFAQEGTYTVELSLNNIDYFDVGTVTVNMPSFTSIAPASSFVYGGIPITATGTGLRGTSSGCRARFLMPSTAALSSTSCTVVDGNTMVATAPDMSAELSPNPSASITVQWSVDSANYETPSFSFTVYAAPVLTGRTPSTGSLGGGSIITLYGSSFLSNAAHDFLVAETPVLRLIPTDASSGAPTMEAPVTYVHSNQMTATLPDVETQYTAALEFSLELDVDGGVQPLAPAAMVWVGHLSGPGMLAFNSAADRSAWGSGSAPVAVVVDNRPWASLVLGSDVAPLMSIDGTNVATSTEYMAEVRIANIATPGAGTRRVTVPIQFDTQTRKNLGRMRFDCADMRVVAADGISYVPFWVEEDSCSGYNGISTIWVSVELTDSADTTIFVTFGSGALLSPPHPRDVFEFFDDFESADSVVWTFPDVPEPLPLVFSIDGTLSFRGQHRDHRFMRTRDPFTFHDQTITVDVGISPSNGCGNVVYFSPDPSTIYRGYDVTSIPASDPLLLIQESCVHGFFEVFVPGQDAVQMPFCNNVRGISVQFGSEGSGPPVATVSYSVSSLCPNMGNVTVSLHGDMSSPYLFLGADSPFSNQFVTFDWVGMHVVEHSAPVYDIVHSIATSSSEAPYWRVVGSSPTMATDASAAVRLSMNNGLDSTDALFQLHIFTTASTITADYTNVPIRIVPRTLQLGLASVPISTTTPVWVQLGLGGLRRQCAVDTSQQTASCDLPMLRQAHERSLYVSLDGFSFDPTGQSMWQFDATAASITPRGSHVDGGASVVIHLETVGADQLSMPAQVVCIDERTASFYTLSDGSTMMMQDEIHFVTQSVPVTSTFTCLLTVWLEGMMLADRTSMTLFTNDVFSDLDSSSMAGPRATQVDFQFLLSNAFVAGMDNVLFVFSTDVASDQTATGTARRGLEVLKLYPDASDVVDTLGVFDVGVTESTLEFLYMGSDVQLAYDASGSGGFAQWEGIALQITEDFPFIDMQDVSVNVLWVPSTVVTWTTPGDPDDAGWTPVVHPRVLEGSVMRADVWSEHDGWLELWFDGAVTWRNDENVVIQIQYKIDVMQVDSSAPRRTHVVMAQTPSARALRAVTGAQNTTSFAAVPRMRFLSSAQSVIDVRAPELPFVGDWNIAVSGDGGAHTSALANKYAVFTDEIELLDVVPRSGPALGGTLATLRGFGNFFDTGNIVVRVRLDNTGATSLFQDTVGTFVSPSEITFTFPPIQTTVSTIKVVFVDLALNGKSFVQELSGRRPPSVTMYHNPSVLAVSPSVSPMIGGVDIAFEATHVLYSRKLSCRFGDEVRSAQHNRPSNSFCESGCTFTCRAPSHPEGPVDVAVSINEVDFHDAGVFVYEPCGDGSVTPYYTVACEQCQPGSYANATRCLRCPLDTYMPNVGANTCWACPEHSYTADSAASLATDCLCDVGYYSLEAGEECLECPSGAECRGQWYPPSSNVGHWSPEDRKGAVMKCLPAESCVGDDFTSNNVTGQMPINATVTARCAGGYTDKLCGTCDDGYYRVALRCEKCPTGSTGGRFGALLVVLILFLVVLYRYGVTVAKTGSLFHVYYFAESMAVISRLDIQWPDRLFRLFFFNYWWTIIDFLAPQCEGADSYWVRWGLSVVPYLVISAVCGVLLLVVRVRKSGKVPMVALRLTNMYVIYASLSLPVMLIKSVQNFAFTDQGDVQTLNAEPSIWKDDISAANEGASAVVLLGFLVFSAIPLLFMTVRSVLKLWRAWWRLALYYMLVWLLTIFCVAVSLFSFLLLMGVMLAAWKKVERFLNRKLKQRSKRFRLAPQYPKSKTSKVAFGSLYRKYTKSAHHWELVVTWRRVFFAVVAVGLSDQPASAILLMGIATAASIFLQFTTLPYRFRSSNFSEVWNLFGTLGMLCAASTYLDSHRGRLSDDLSNVGFIGHNGLETIFALVGSWILAWLCGLCIKEVTWRIICKNKRLGAELDKDLDVWKKVGLVHDDEKRWEGWRSTCGEKTRRAGVTKKGDMFRVMYDLENYAIKHWDEAVVSRKNFMGNANVSIANTFRHWEVLVERRRTRPAWVTVAYKWL